MSSLPLSASTITDSLRAAGCVFAEDEARLLVEAGAAPDELGRMVRRRVAGHPLEHILGWAGFAGLRIAVTPGVFVPRRRTEALVEEAVALCGPRSVVLDLCCGSGALGAAVSAAVPGVELYASDIEPVAVECARRNLAPFPVFEGDLFSALPASLRGRIDVLLCNTPYVPTGEIRMLPPEAREHEPLATLDGGPDGLDVQRRVAAEAAFWLAPGGSLLVEASERQAEQASAILERHGLRARTARSDELDATVVIGTRTS
jgi:release factor glutamine methyltransferase